jgi:hypothetical protein
MKTENRPVFAVSGVEVRADFQGSLRELLWVIR